ncbi:hypothetical protein COY28_05280 [Candidatus Woesearchaeota archaeon CG_4_10_14_0_2_um_filter_57_5]|nr:MAG: hypothetical protein COY28_05280 [Candidatus Woesearchaeota archaeon CG_4_10_14_0_2_um_filter_57_5]
MRLRILSVMSGEFTSSIIAVAVALLLGLVLSPPLALLAGVVAYAASCWPRLRRGSLLRLALGYLFGIAGVMTLSRGSLTAAGVAADPAGLAPLWWGVLGMVLFCVLAKPLDTMQVPKVMRHPLFLWILLVKLALSLFFGSHYYVDGTMPFVSHFITSGFANPYDAFLALGQVKAFPYSTAMLLFLALPLFVLSPLWSGSLFASGVAAGLGPSGAVGGAGASMLQLLLFRLPLLLADIGILLLLCRMLPTREEKVLWYYWASPIAIYITYFHGQLDVIPVFLLLASLYLLLREQYPASFAVLGLALSAKANIFVAVPFIFLYLWRRRQSLERIIGHFALSGVVYAILALPFVSSPGYQALVVHAEEQFWLFLLQVPYHVQGLVLYLAPLALVLFFFRVAYFKTFSQNGLFMSLAVAFTLLVTLVPPRPGWFYWSIPFLAYFFIRDERLSKKYYTLINGSYLLYFLVLSPQSDLFSSLRVPADILPVSVPSAFFGSNAVFFANLGFTLFVGVLLSNIYFIYRRGLLETLEVRERPLSIGVAGDSGSGKSTLTGIISDLVGAHNLTVLEGDDLHRWERGDANWESLTHLDPKANKLALDAEHLAAIKNSQQVERREYDHGNGQFTDTKSKAPGRFVIVSGLHSFYLARMRALLDLKIFLEPEETLRREWKLTRDSGERKHSGRAVARQIQKRLPDSKKHILPQRQFADLVLRFVREGPAASSRKADKRKPSLLLEVTLKNHYDVQALLAALDNALVCHDYSDDLEHMSMMFSEHITSSRVAGVVSDAGSPASPEALLTPEAIARIAYHLYPNLEELLDNRRPRWRGGYNGIIQLLVLLLLADSARTGESHG